MRHKSIARPGTRVTRKIFWGMEFPKGMKRADKKWWWADNEEEGFKQKFYFSIHCHVAKRLVAKAAETVPLGFQARNEFIKGLHEAYTVGINVKEGTDPKQSVENYYLKMGFHKRWQEEGDAGEAEKRREFAGAFFSAMEEFFKEIDKKAIGRSSRFFIDFMHALNTLKTFYAGGLDADGKKAYYDTMEQRNKTIRSQKN